LERKVEEGKVQKTVAYRRLGPVITPGGDAFESQRFRKPAGLREVWVSTPRRRVEMTVKENIERD